MFFNITLRKSDFAEPDDPTKQSVIAVVVALALVAALLFLFDRIYAKHFAQATTALVSRDWNVMSKLAFLGRLLIFVICVAIALGVAYLRVFQSESIRLTAFIIVLLLGCVISGLVSEETAGNLFPWAKK